MDTILIKDKEIKSIKDFKIILFSDVHYDDKMKQEVLDNILLRIKNKKPDYICIPGDLLDESKNNDITRLLTFLKLLGEIAPVYISVGNHDMMYQNKTKWEKDENYQQNFDKMATIKNINVLNNSNIIDGKINFIGYNPPFEHYEEDRTSEFLTKDINKNLPEFYAEELYNILITHDPRILTTADQIKVLKSIDLMVSGHMHGGLVPEWITKIIKGTRGLISPERNFLPKYSRGKVTKYRLTAIISSGITKLSRTSGILSNINFIYEKNIKEISVSDKKLTR